MKLWVFSDLHFDVNKRHPFALPEPRPAHDAVIIAGDIDQGIGNGLRFIAENGLDAKPVIYVAGNHEYYNRDRHAELEEGRAQAARYPNIHLLERDRVVIGGVEILGCTLWTDYRYPGAADRDDAMQAAAQRLNDHCLIWNGDRNWLPRDCIEEHDGSRKWLAERLGERSAHARVVVTHHAPSRRSVHPDYTHDVLTAAFTSDLDDLAAKAALWAHGHMHESVDYLLGGCRVIANPRGYVSLGEGRAFDPALVVEVPARSVSATAPEAGAR